MGWEFVEKLFIYFFIDLLFPLFGISSLIFKQVVYINSCVSYLMKKNYKMFSTISTDLQYLATLVAL